MKKKGGGGTLNNFSSRKITNNWLTLLVTCGSVDTRLYNYKVDYFQAFRNRYIVNKSI